MNPRLDRLFQDEFAPMVRLARLVSNAPSEVEDIVMDAFEQTTRRLDDLVAPGAYLRTAVINGARRRYRNEQRRSSIIERNQLTLVSADLTGPTDYLGDILAALPEREHTIIVLVYYLGMTPTEAAQELGVPAGTIRSTVHRTLKKLRTQVIA